MESSILTTALLARPALQDTDDEFGTLANIDNNFTTTLFPLSRSPSHLFCIVMSGTSRKFHDLFIFVTFGSRRSSFRCRRLSAPLDDTLPLRVYPPPLCSPVCIKRQLDYGLCLVQAKGEGDPFHQHRTNIVSLGGY